MLAEMKPGTYCITSSVAPTSSAANSWARSGRTVKTLMRVAYPACGAMVDMNLLCQVPYTHTVAQCKVPVMRNGDVEAGAGYLIKRVQQSLRRRCDAGLRPTGLSMAQ